jgi:hypothetical protein
MIAVPPLIAERVADPKALVLVHCATAWIEPSTVRKKMKQRRCRLLVVLYVFILFILRVSGWVY